MDASEACVDTTTHKLVHGLSVPFALDAIYRDIVECGGGHMMKEGLLDMQTLCYMNKNLLEVSDQLTRVNNGPIDANTLRGWETTIRSTIGLGFLIGWLDELLIKVNDRNDPSAQLPDHISQLENQLVQHPRQLHTRRWR